MGKVKLSFDSDMNTLFHSYQKAQCEIGISEKYFFLGKGSPEFGRMFQSFRRSEKGLRFNLRTQIDHWRWYAYVWLHATVSSRF